MAANYKKAFNRVLKQAFPKEYRALLDETEQHFAHISKDVAFAARSANPMDRRLDFSAYFLSLIKAMEKSGEPYDAIRRVCLAVATEYVRPKNRLQAFLKRLPPKLMGTRIGRLLTDALHKKVSVKGHEDGFEAHIITDKAETYGLGYGVNITACGICKLFDKHDSGKYTHILCEVDKITTSLAGLEMYRTGTISGGAAVCDFRYRKKLGGA